MYSIVCEFMDVMISAYNATLFVFPKNFNLYFKIQLSCHVMKFPLIPLQDRENESFPTSCLFYSSLFTCKSVILKLFISRDYFIHFLNHLFQDNLMYKNVISCQCLCQNILFLMELI